MAKSRKKDAAAAPSELASAGQKCNSPKSCDDTTPGHSCGVRRNPHVDKTQAAKDLRK